MIGNLNVTCGTQIKKYKCGCVVARDLSGLFFIIGQDEGIRPSLGEKFGLSDFFNSERIADIVKPMLCPHVGGTGQDKG